MIKDELIKRFECPDYQREGNKDFGRILGLSRHGSIGDIHTTVNKELITVLSFQPGQCSWEGEDVAVFSLLANDGSLTYFSIIGDASSWDSWGSPEHTSPWSIKLVQPVQKMITVYEEVKDNE